MCDNLTELLRDHSIHLSFKKKLDIGIEIVKGMIYLHYGWKEVILHRDMKAENILISRNNEIKICDLGISKACPRENAYTVTDEPMDELDA